MKPVKTTISLQVKPNSHRANIIFGDKLNLFCPVQASVTERALSVAGIKIKYLAWKSADTFTITTDDAARLLNRLSQRDYDAQVNKAVPEIATKWEMQTQFVSGDFE